ETFFRNAELSEIVAAWSVEQNVSTWRREINGAPAAELSGACIAGAADTDDNHLGRQTAKHERVEQTHRKVNHDGPVMIHLAVGLLNALVFGGLAPEMIIVGV